MSFIDSSLPNKLNTIELEKGSDPFGDVGNYCTTYTTGEELDNNLGEVFSLENKIEVFGENYKDKNVVQVTNPDGTSREVSIPTIVNGGMGTNVSSASMVNAMNELGFGGHLSSIGLGFYYFQDNFEGFFDEKKTPLEEQKNIVKQEFDKLFIQELGLSKDFIEKHFFECSDLGVEINEKTGEPKKNAKFNGQAGRQREVRMMDLIATYRTVKKLKESGNNVGLNAMFKTSSYISMLKLAVLAGVDYVTTAAGNPDKNPKEFLKEFLDSVKDKGYKMPAFGLLISGAKALSDFDYDYYIFEEGKKAGGHIIRMGDKYEELLKMKAKFEKEGKVMPPIYAAGGINSGAELKRALETGFAGVQIGTSLAVSEEAVDGKGEEFKKRLISRNHLGPKTDIDDRGYEMIMAEKAKFEQLIRVYSGRVLKALNTKDSSEYYDENSPEIRHIRDFIYKAVYSSFYGEEITNLTDKEQELLNKVRAFIEKSYTNKKGEVDIKEIHRVLRQYGNAMKFLKGFEKFVNDNNGEIPTHIVFDSTAGFPGRSRIVKGFRKVIAGLKATRQCIGCLTDCTLMDIRGNVRPDRGSPFCIYDWLDQNEDRDNIAFSSPSTVPYNEIRPIRDIMAFFLGKYVTSRTKKAA